MRSVLYGLQLVSAFDDLVIGRSGPTSEEYRNGSPSCGRPRFYHKWNLFFELPDERRRRSSATVPLERNYGANGREWFKKSEKEIKKAKRKAERKGETYTAMGNNSTARLIGGDVAIPHSWPWQAFVKIEGKAGGYDCGGSIIDNKWILTAAHCVPYKPMASKSYVYVGLHKIHTGQKQKLGVKRVIVHPNYGHPILDNNDIALVELQRPLTYSESVQPICLPDKTVCLPTGTKCAATGWGVTDKFATQIPDELNEVGVKIIEKDICENIHPDYHNQLSDEMLCAGYKEGGKDACLGDSGGPLACQVGGSEGPWLLYGITSWGIGCGDPLHPGVYARVTKLIGWVTEQTGIRGSISSSDFGLTCGAQPEMPDEKPDEKPGQPVKTETNDKPEPVETTEVSISSAQATINQDLLLVKSCGGRTNEKTGNLRTPGYGKKYPSGVTCLWQIDPELGNSSFVEIEFKRNDVGQCNTKGIQSGPLPSDYVAVLDSTGKIKGGAICKSSSKSPLLVYSRRAASILLHSSGDGGNNGKGFRLRFRTIDWEPSGCGDPKKYVLASNDPIHISSMNWPSKYNSGINCKWEIFAPLGHVILVEVTDFWIGDEPSNGCKKTSVSLNDSDNSEMARLCGKLSPSGVLSQYYQTSGRQLEVNFNAGDEPVKRGFRIKLRAIPKNDQKSVRAFGGNKAPLQSNFDIISRIEKLLNILKARLNYDENAVQV